VTALVATPVDPDVALRLSRRVDWRFLLPSPRLGRIGYLGMMDGQLLAALAAFADQVVVDPAALRTGSLDGVVVHRPARVDIEAAARAVRPGGLLVAELHGPQVPVIGGSRPLGVGAVLQCWTRAGATESRAYWLLPSRSSCTMMVDLNDEAMVLAALDRNQGSRSGRRKAAAGRRLLASGLLRHVAPDVTIIAVKGS
jgi:hypothetical protein